MKYLILIIVLFITGCASVSVNPTTGEISYWRIGDQHLKGVSFKNDNGLVIVKFETQDSEATALNNAITVLGGLATK